MPHGFCLAAANEPERNVAAALLERMRGECKLHGSELVIGDRGFAGHAFEQIVAALAAGLLPPRPKRRTTPPRLPRRRPAMDRIDHQHRQRPTLARTSRRPHTRR
jgi:hypothetical protein